jgi:hypothetical protein
VAAKLVGTYVDLPSHWALRTKIAKQALKVSEPKRLMKYLGYRSIESMLKRENIYELFLAAQVLESNTWQKGLMKYISHLDQTGFEMRPINLVNLSRNKWSMAEADDFAVYDNLIGAAGLWPDSAMHGAPLLNMVLLLIESFKTPLHLLPGTELVKMNMVMWWVDMDHLVYELADEHVSLNVKDCALNSWFKNSFEERIIDQGLKNFWQALVDRYQNRPAIEAPFEDNISQRIAGLKAAIPDPALEFAEEFDG